MSPTQNHVKINALNLRLIKLPQHKIIKVYSDEYGLLSLSGKRLGGRSEPFVHNIFYIKYNPQKDIQQIQHSEFQQHFHGLQKDFERLSYAMYICELVEVFSHLNDPVSKDIYLTLYDTLARLHMGYETPVEIILYFLWEFIDLAGYKPNLTLLETSYNHDSLFFCLEDGELTSSINRTNTKYLIQLLPRIQKGIHNLLHTNISSIEPEIQNFILSMLQRYLHHKSDSKLKTFDILKQLLWHEELTAKCSL